MLGSDMWEIAVERATKLLPDPDGPEQIVTSLSTIEET
jgi:hypothetical protein